MSDDELWSAFHARALAAFPHRDHVRLAFVYLRRADAVTFCRELRAFAADMGAPGKYDEALTLAWLGVIGARISPADRTSEDLLARCPDLLDRGAVRSAA